MNLNLRSLHHLSAMICCARPCLPRLQDLFVTFLLFNMARQVLAGSLRIASCVVGLGALSACGNGPSEAEIERVVKATVAQEKAAMGRLVPGGRNVGPTVHAVKKLGCKEASSNVYACDVELDVTPLVGERTKAPTTIRVAKGSDGWAAMR